MNLTQKVNYLLVCAIGATLFFSCKSEKKEEGVIISDGENKIEISSKNVNIATNEGGNQTTDVQIGENGVTVNKDEVKIGKNGVKVNKDGITIGKKNISLKDSEISSGKTWPNSMPAVFPEFKAGQIVEADVTKIGDFQAVSIEIEDVTLEDALAYVAKLKKNGFRGENDDNDLDYTLLNDGKACTFEYDSDDNTVSIDIAKM